MKKIEDIEKLSLEDLERISLDSSVTVPEGFEDRVRASVEEHSSSRHRILWLAGAAASLVVIASLGLSLRPKPLKDTFDDPVVAYAEVERALLSFTETVNNQMNSIKR